MASARRKQWLKHLIDNKWQQVQEAVGMELNTELGCGSFGCVFAPANDSPWVVKMTSDPDEAVVWQAIIELTESERDGTEGYTKVKEIIRLLPDYKKKQVYAIVREAVMPLLHSEGGYSTFSRQVVAPALLPSTGFAASAARWITYGSGSIDGIERQARDLVQCVHWISKYHEAAQYIHEYHRPGRRKPMPTYGGYGYGPTSIEAAKNQLQRSIDMLKIEYTWQLGQTLEVLWAHQLVLNDLRPANVGWRYRDEFREDDEDYTLVLFDPGYTKTGRKSAAREVHIANPSTDFEWYQDELR